jgi:DNA polymerase (family X)
MTNKEIARRFSDLAAIMELHNENPFKIRSYANAYITLRKLDTPLADMPRAEMDVIKGVGKTIGDKIQELLQTGDMQAFRKYADETPAGVVDMLSIKGFGPKKIQAVWKELGIETVGELLYACNENRLIELHGFGKKTQDEIRKNAEYYLRSRHKIHWATADEMATATEKYLKEKLPTARIERTGELRRLMPTVERLDFLVGYTEGSQNNGENSSIAQVFDNEHLTLVDSKENSFLAKNEEGFAVQIFTCLADEFGSKQFKYSGSRPFLEAFLKNMAERYPDSIGAEGSDFRNLSDEKLLFEKAKLPFIAPELRENGDILTIAAANQLPNLINLGDIKGVIHTHTTYSDGLHSVEEMAKAAQHLGYQYIGITDHSKAAFYANGLKEDRVLAQWEEIERLNGQFFNFKILKGIECDILNDGAMDYNEELLSGFDFVIASVHSNLKMNEEKATARIIKAVENQYVTILGHPTGRLLLSREGYPLDHEKVIDACAANGVTIELNAHPWRLDVDWTWIPRARERGVLISVNPDAHSTSGINDIRYGIMAARKGGLDVAGCLNTRSVDDFLLKR